MVRRRCFRALGGCRWLSGDSGTTGCVELDVENLTKGGVGAARCFSDDTLITLGLAVVGRFPRFAHDARIVAVCTASTDANVRSVQAGEDGMAYLLKNIILEFNHPEQSLEYVEPFAMLLVDDPVVSALHPIPIHKSRAPRGVKFADTFSSPFMRTQISLNPTRTIWQPCYATQTKARSRSTRWGSREMTHLEQNFQTLRVFHRCHTIGWGCFWDAVCEEF